jgi:tocopherol O-methyltransferase
MILPATPQGAEAVAAHYDELDVFYREVWGEHVHHGYWAEGGESADAAADALVDLLADRMGFAAGQAVCDIGCGYGASARRLAARWGVRVTGVTISAAQAGIAATRMREQPGVTVELRDWLANGFADGSFDRAYAIESTEHMGDKQRCFDEAYRTLRPGGRLGVFAWLAGDRPRGWEVRHLLEPICREGRLPGMGDEADYRRMAERAGFRVASVEDLSVRVRRTWTICARRLLGRIATRPKYVRFLLDATARNRIFAVTVLRLMLAYRTGAMRYCLLIMDR